MEQLKRFRAWVGSKRSSLRTYRELRANDVKRADAYFIGFGFRTHMHRHYPDVEVAPDVLQRQRAAARDDPRGEARR